MAGAIFLVQDGGELVELTAQPYEAEAILQRLIADYPNILAGDQVGPNGRQRWLLISREASIPAEEGGAGRWALDHLFLDQNAVPTLVEVKRSSDTRTRREVVAQMLDYAANAIVYWPAEAIRAQFEATCTVTGRDPQEALADFLEPGAEPETFWSAAQQNLLAERVRLVFVADIIPPELRRIVEFLNGQMNPAEVIAIEVKQFVGQELRALVPQVVGQTAAAQQAKAAVRSSEKRKWNETSFFEDLEARRGPQELMVARDIYDWSKRQGLQFWWGEGSKDGSFFPLVEHGRVVNLTVAVWTYGRVEIQFQRLSQEQGEAKLHPFVSEEKRVDLLRRLNEIPGVNFDLSVITKRPSIPLSGLVDSDVRRHFFTVLDWLVAELRGSPSQSAGV